MQPKNQSNSFPLPPSAGPQRLSPAEQSVVTLLLEGLSNKAIAQRLILSPRTVESHISHALAKTGCQSRLELTLWLIANCQPEAPASVVTLPGLPA